MSILFLIRSKVYILMVLNYFQAHNLKMWRIFYRRICPVRFGRQDDVDQKSNKISINIQFINSHYDS